MRFNVRAEVEFQLTAGREPRTLIFKPTSLSAKAFIQFPQGMEASLTSLSASDLSKRPSILVSLPSAAW